MRAPIRLCWLLRTSRQGHRHQQLRQPQPQRRHNATATDRNRYGDANRNTDCYFYRYTECHTHSYTHIHAYSDRDVNAKPYSDAKVYASAEDSAHSGPETLIASDRGEVITDSCRPRAHPFAKSFRRPTRCFRLYPLQIIIFMTSKTLLTAALGAAIGCTCTALASANIINIMPSKDNTLYEYDPKEGDFSNALGFHFFAGETGMSELRRGVLAFDIAGSIPPGSMITSASLSVNMSRSPTNTAYVVELHKLLADWGEGTSIAPGEEGDGAPATANDATWRHRFFDTIFWTTQGGDFSATVSASQSVGGTGHYTWSSAQMVADVQSWLDNPASNFGWLVLGDETAIATAKRFDTRESASPPMLTIEFRVPRMAPSPRARPTPAPRP